MNYTYNNDTKYIFKITEETKIICPYTFGINIWESESISYFFSKVPVDKSINIIDIGAQAGLYSLYAKFLPLSTFYSFEPYQISFNLLNDNIKLNNITNVKTFNMGIGEKESDMNLNVCKSHNGLHTLGKKPLRFDDIDQEIVKVTTIDSMFYDKNIDVDFIKIDTEGYEYFILLGGIKTIKKNKPLIQLEWNLVNMEQCEVNENMLNKLIEDLGYKKTYVLNEELIIEPIFKIDLNFINFDKKRIKIDIGLSYSAPHSQDWLSKDDDLLVIGFEPNPDCVECILSGNIVKKHHQHGTPIENKYINTSFFILPFALSNVDEPILMDFYNMQNDCGTSSLLEPIDLNNFGPIKEKIKVPVYSLKHFFDFFPFEKFEYIEYLKIDAQGSDLDILKGAGEYIKKIVYITAEAENTQYINSENNTIENITKYLTNNGFIHVDHQNTNDPTFINQRFLHLKDSIYISQFG